MRSGSGSSPSTLCEFGAVRAAGPRPTLPWEGTETTAEAVGAEGGASKRGGARHHRGKRERGGERTLEFLAQTEKG